MTIKIMAGDVLKQLALLADESVHCVVTSPPYYGLRDYGVKGQMGLEKTLGEHIGAMVNVFREIRRVLRKDGTCWINYGDCYATSPNGRSAAATKAAGKDDRTFRDKPFSTIQGKLKPKDLMMTPNRLAIALQDDGWFVRSEIIWHKPNPMPESITDRPATAHEKIFLLTKSGKYFYDAKAVCIPMSVNSIARLSQNIENQAGSDRANGGKKTNGTMKAVGGWVRDKGGCVQNHGPYKQSGHGRRHAGFNERYRAKGNARTFRGGIYSRNAQFDNSENQQRDSHGNVPNETGMANLKNVWTLSTRGFSEAHFATFPPELPEICIKAGCPIGGTVLDPFGGSGTTALVADRLGRDAILIELNPDYVKMAEKRLIGDAPLFVEIEKPKAVKGKRKNANPRRGHKR